MRGEFELIARYFEPLAGATPGSFALRNDAATFSLENGEEGVVTVDTLAQGVHFLPDDPADLVARKLLRVNLSDLAAMGARPLGYLIAAAWPRDFEENWIAEFAEGLAEDQRDFGLSLLGGDTTATSGPLVLSLTALGAVPRGAALTRAGAEQGDLVYVSGSLGDAVFGLRALRGELQEIDAELRASLVQRYRLPRPRLELGRALLEERLASAAIDVSDGLLADLTHLAEESGLGAEVDLAALPLSPELERLLGGADAGRIEAATGGDDYELLFTVRPDAAPRLTSLAQQLELPLSAIGRMTPAGPVRLLDRSGKPLAVEHSGWTHF